MLKSFSFLFFNHFWFHSGQQSLWYHCIYVWAFKLIFFAQCSFQFLPVLTGTFISVPVSLKNPKTCSSGELHFNFFSMWEFVCLFVSPWKTVNLSQVFFYIWSIPCISPSACWDRLLSDPEQEYAGREIGWMEETSATTTSVSSWLFCLTYHHPKSCYLVFLMILWFEIFQKFRKWSQLCINIKFRVSYSLYINFSFDHIFRFSGFWYGGQCKKY